MSCLIKEWSDAIDLEEQIKYLREIHQREYILENFCIYCKEKYKVTGNLKAFDHDHYRCIYTGSACNTCNLKAKKSALLDVFCHNSQYDNNLILEHLDFTKINNTN